jgi:hypothetical protein
MAARRLLIVMLILLGLSTLAAALVPPQALREGTTTGTTTEETETATSQTETQPAGRQLPSPISITVGEGNRVPVVSCPPSLRRAKRCKPILVGDQFTLLVKSKRADELDMPAFGLVDAVGPDEPARFELLVEAARSYQIRFVSTGEVAARIVVEKLGAAKRAKNGGGEKKEGEQKPARSRAPAEPGLS